MTAFMSFFLFRSLPLVPSPEAALLSPIVSPLLSAIHFTPSKSGVRLETGFQHYRKQGWIHQFLSGQHDTPNPLQNCRLGRICWLGEKSVDHWASAPCFLHDTYVLPRRNWSGPWAEMPSQARRRSRGPRTWPFVEAHNAARAVGRFRYAWWLSLSLEGFSWGISYIPIVDHCQLVIRMRRWEEGALRDWQHRSGRYWGADRRARLNLT